MKLGFSPLRAFIWWVSGLLVIAAWVAYYRHDAERTFKRATVSAAVTPEKAAVWTSKVRACVLAPPESERFESFYEGDVRLSFGNRILLGRAEDLSLLREYVEAHRASLPAALAILEEAPQFTGTESRLPELREVFRLVTYTSMQNALEGRADEAWRLNRICFDYASRTISASSGVLPLLTGMAQIELADEAALVIAWKDRSVDRVTVEKKRISTTRFASIQLRRAFEDNIEAFDGKFLAASSEMKMPFPLRWVYLRHKTESLMAKKILTDAVVERPKSAHRYEYRVWNLVPWAPNFGGSMMARAEFFTAHLISKRFWQMEARSRCVDDALAIRLASLSGTAPESVALSDDLYSDEKNHYDRSREIIWSNDVDFKDNHGDGLRDLVLYLPGAHADAGESRN